MMKCKVDFMFWWGYKVTIIIGRNVKCVWLYGVWPSRDLAVDQPCQFGKSDGYTPSVGVGMNERQLGAGQCNYQS